MNTTEINECFRGENYFIGTFPRNLLPRTKMRPCAMIVNTDAANEPGEHWVSILLLPGGTGEYFDPFGLPPLHYTIQNYLGKYCPNKLQYNPRSLQFVTSTQCGKYSIVFLILRSRGFSFSEVLKKFCSNSKHNDGILDKFLL